MTAPSTPTGGYPPAFPRKAQPVAFRGSSADRSSHSRRARLENQASRGALGEGEHLVRAHPVLSLFAASLIAFAPVHALAQDRDREARTSVRERPRPDYDPLGLRFGGFTLHATLDLDAVHSDNIFAEETGEDEDTIFVAALRTRLQSNWSRHALAIEAGGAASMYDEFASEDHETAFAGVSGRLDIGSRSNLSARARVAQEIEPRNDPDAPGQGIPLVEYERSELAVSAQHTFNRFRVTATAAQSQNEYDAGQSFRDFEETSLTGRLEAELTPRIGLLAQATTDERDYDNTPALSSEGRTYLAGLTINLTDLMEGQVAVGHFERDYDSGITTDGVAASANVEWYVTRLTTISFNARRNSEDVVGATTAIPYVESEYGGRVDHELMRNVILTAGAQFGRREYEGIDRDDDFMRADVGADYLVNRRVVVRGRYMHDEVESEGVNRYRDYEENRFTLGVGLRL